MWEAFNSRAICAGVLPSAPSAKICFTIGEAFGSGTKRIAVLDTFHIHMEGSFQYSFHPFMRIRREERIFFEISLAYISFIIFLNGIMSESETAESYPVVDCNKADVHRRKEKFSILA